MRKIIFFVCRFNPGFLIFNALIDQIYSHETILTHAFVVRFAGGGSTFGESESDYRDQWNGTYFSRRMHAFRTGAAQPGYRYDPA